MKIHGKKVLVTGADGFIGSHLTEVLHENGADVIALSQYNSFNNWGWLEDLKCLNDIRVVTGDVRDSNYCNKITKGVDVILNLAALIAIPYSYIAPASYIDTNINGALNICQAALNNEVSRVVQISTSEVYGTAKYVPIDELHPLQPQSPYSASKIGADSIAMSFYNSFELPVTVARPFNTYGPRQSARAIIPTVITQIASGLNQIKLGDLTPTRDFNYVKDTCNGLAAITSSDETIGEIINIGSNTEISMLETVNIINEIMGNKSDIIFDENRIRPQNSEVHRLLCDNRKIKEMTSFEPKFDIRRGLTETIEWFSDPINLKKYKAGIYNV